ncbi:MAG: DUF3426 domain-containing protein [Rhodanobacteraceae bacterium]
MYTQCPKCRTIFEIDEGALQASLGIVRCGHCAERFDALRTLSGDLPAGPDTMLPEHDPEQHAPTLTHTISPTSPGDIADPSGSGEVRDSPQADVASAVEAATVNGAPGRPAPPADRLMRATLAEPVGMPPGAVLGDRAWLVLAVPVQMNHADPGIATFVPVTDADGLPVGSGTRAEPAGAQTPTVARSLVAGTGTSDTAPTLPDPGAYAASVVGEPVYVPPRRPVRRSTWLWALGCAVLALTLAAQVAWASRAALVRDSATRAWSLAVCTKLDCRLPPIRDVAKLELVSRDVRADPRAAGALSITATVRNNAAFRQPWPVVVVELTDLDDEVVAMRRFAPADYVPDAARRRAGIAPGTTAAIAFEVADPGTRATGFHFGFE